MIKFVVNGIERRRRAAHGRRDPQGRRLRRLPEPRQHLPAHARAVAAQAARPPRARGVAGRRRHRPLRALPGPGPRDHRDTTCPSRSTPTSSRRCAPSCKRPTRRGASSDRTSARPAVRAAQDRRDRGQRRPRQRPHPGAPRPGQDRPRDPGRRAAAGHGDRRGAHEDRRVLHSRGAAQRAHHAGRPRHAQAVPGRRRQRHHRRRRHRHGRRRPARHRQEPGGDDAPGRRLCRLQPGHRRHRRSSSSRRSGSTSRSSWA